MGFVKQKMLELESRHISSVPDKNVCVKHIEDKALKKFIRKNYSLGYCDYCEKEVKVVSLESLIEFIMEGVSNFYEDAANFMNYNSREGGYLGETYTPDELIQDLIGLETDPFELTDDIVNSIDNIAWAEPDMYYDTERDELMYQWEYFKKIVKHNSRFIFLSKSGNLDHQNATKILKEVGRLLPKLNLIKKIEKGKKLFRARQHKSTDIIDSIEQIVSPPIKYAIYPNRFSPSGIPMLYTAFDKKTAIVETVDIKDKQKNKTTIAELVLDKDVYVIDFSRLPEIPSIFGITNKKKYYLITFIYGLVRDMTKSIEKDGKEHIEYIPTQVITEYLRFPFNKNRNNKIEGIIYSSSKEKGKIASVFFWDNKESVEFLKLDKLTKKGTKTMYNTP